MTFRTISQNLGHFKTTLSIYLILGYFKIFGHFERPVRTVGFLQYLDLKFARNLHIYDFLFSILIYFSLDGNLSLDEII